MTPKIVTNGNKTFFESLEQDETISRANKNIIKRYIQSIIDDRPKKSQSTIDYNIKVMKFVLKHIKTDLDKLTIDDIDDFKTILGTWKRGDGKDVAESTINIYKIVFKRFLYYYSERDEEKSRLYTNLIKQLKVGKSITKKPDILTKEEIELMIKTAVWSRDKAIIATLYESGCRIGELAQCRVGDFTLSPEGGGKLHFPGGKTGKRTVTLVYAASYIDGWITRDHCQNTDKNAPLWLTLDGKESRKLAYDSIYGLVKKLAKQSGIEKSIHPHTFRHTRATQLAKVWTEPQMKKYLGWTPNSNVASMYIHLEDEDMNEAVLALNGLVEKKVDDGRLEVDKCPRCRKIVPSNAIFCYNCGLSLSEEGDKNVSIASQQLMQLQMMCPSGDWTELLQTLKKLANMSKM